MVSDINKLGLDVKWQDLTPGCTIVGSCTAEVFRTEERLSPGHRMCAGCGATIAVRNVLRGLHEEDEAVITCATGCLEVSSSCIHTLHGKILLFIMLSKMPEQPAVE